MDVITRLARAAAAGDREATGALVAEMQADVWRLCAHLVDRGSADDLTQETFVRAISALRSYRGDSSGRTFLFSITRNTCMDELRRRSRRRIWAGAEPQPMETDRPAPDPAGRIALEQLVASLDPDRREAFVLTQIVGLSYAEAADVCGCPLGTIRSRVARARAELVEALSPTNSRGVMSEGVG